MREKGDASRKNLQLLSRDRAQRSRARGAGAGLWGSSEMGKNGFSLLVRLDISCRLRVSRLTAHRALLLCFGIGPSVRPIPRTYLGEALVGY